MPPQIEELPEDEVSTDQPVDQPQGETVDLTGEELTVEDTEDGGALITLENEAESAGAEEHFANIADDVDQNELDRIAVDLYENIMHDLEARDKRDKLYEEGLKRTGLADEAPGGATFAGASKVVHPLLIEACVDFSARVMKELAPPGGPVKSKVYGPQDADKLAKASRKAEFMNWQLTEQIPEFRPELEQLSTQLPLGGVQYLKWVWDKRRRRAVPEFVPIDDMIIPFSATNFYTAERRAHRQYVTEAKYLKRVEEGMYRDAALGVPMDPDFSAAEKANQKIEGKTPTTYNEDGLRTVYEVTTWLDIESPGEPRPYVITIDDSTRRVLALTRNWDLDDDKYEELEHAVEFPFIPWRGALAIGLTHMIGSLAGASTGALRALLDSAHISNIPSGLKLKGGANGQTLNPRIGEITEVESSGATDDIRKIFMPLPFNQPSAVLFQLLGFLVDAGKGVVQTSFEKLADANPNAPVGTTLALIEQGMVVFSSIHSRLHVAMSKCFKILHRLNSSYLTDDDIEAFDCGIEVTPADFDGPMDVVPVSDPQIFSETQRFAQTQAVQQRAGMLPQLYDMRKVEMMFLRTLKINPDDVLIKEPGKEDLDPCSENVAATMGQPIYVLPKQEHLEHIQVHLAFLKSPVFGQHPTIVRTYLYPMAQHLRDHVLNMYLSECHNAISKAKSFGVPLDTSNAEVQLIASVQQAVEQQLGQFSAILAQIDQLAEQFKPQPPMAPQDHSLQIAQMTLQQKAQSDAQKNQLEQGKLQQKQQSEQLDAQLTQQELALRKELDELKERNRVLVAQLETAANNKRAAETNASRERINAADNQTAINIASAEIATSEKIGVSTGTGINPNP